MEIISMDDRIYSPDRFNTGPVYGEKIIRIDGEPFREWIPWRSKLAALLKNGELPFEMKGDILYLGAAQGTTVSHISDVLEDGTIYAVEFSRTAIRKLMVLAGKRSNIVPILADAFKPDLYKAQVPRVDILYQDVSQKDQFGLFLKNSSMFLKKGGKGLIMIKARSIDVTARPESIFKEFGSKLRKEGFDVLENVDLAPFQKDHSCLIVEKSL